jgi:hypothetical protein
MNKFTILFTYIILFIAVAPTITNAEAPYITPKCPKLTQLVDTSVNDVDELFEALKTIVPDVVCSWRR